MRIYYAGRFTFDEALWDQAKEYGQGRVKANAGKHLKGTRPAPNVDLQWHVDGIMGELLLMEFLRQQDVEYTTTHSLVEPFPVKGPDLIIHFGKTRIPIDAKFIWFPPKGLFLINREAHWRHHGEWYFGPWVKDREGDQCTMIMAPWWAVDLWPAKAMQAGGAKRIAKFSKLQPVYDLSLSAPDVVDWKAAILTDAAFAALAKEQSNG